MKFTSISNQILDRLIIRIGDETIPLIYNKRNFDLFWKDEKGEFMIITDNVDVSVALQKLDGPLYEIHAFLQSKGNENQDYI